MSLHSLVQQQVVTRIRPRPEARAEAATAPTSLVEPAGPLPAGTAPAGSMRILEGVAAIGAIVTALLIGAR